MAFPTFPTINVKEYEPQFFDRKNLTDMISWPLALYGFIPLAYREKMIGLRVALIATAALSALIFYATYLYRCRKFTDLDKKITGASILHSALTNAYESLVKIKERNFSEKTVVDVASLQKSLEEATNTINEHFRNIIYFSTYNLLFKKSIEDIKKHTVDNQWMVFTNNLNFDQYNSTDTVNIFRKQAINKISIIVDNILDEARIISFGRSDHNSNRITNEYIYAWSDRIKEV